MRILIVLIFIVKMSYSQTYEATYQFEINKKSFKDQIKKKISEGEDPTLLKKAFSRYFTSRPAKTKLIFNSEASYYYVVQDMGIDEQTRKIDPTVMLAGGNSKYYNSQNQDSVLIHVINSRVKINEFLIKDEKEQVILKNQKKIIGDYKCFLAEAEFSKKNNLKLWYTRDIPTNFNIKNYESLPGLLIKTF